MRANEKLQQEILCVKGVKQVQVDDKGFALHAFVVGGHPEDIGDVINRSLPPGKGTMGNRKVRRQEGTHSYIRFSRPSAWRRFKWWVDHKVANTVLKALGVRK
jgi:hypothetical protein